MAEPLGDHRHRYAGAEHGGSHEVPKVVQPEGGQAGAAAVRDEALGHPVGQPQMTPAVLIVPLTANVSIGVGALSHAGQFNLMVVGDRDLYPDLDVFVDGVRYALGTLELRGALACHREGRTTRLSRQSELRVS